MARTLNEYCLHHINSFLEPHDWIQVSKVCKLWQLATLRQWKTMTVIEHLGNKQEDPGVKNATIISAVDAGKIVLGVAPFVKVLETFDSIQQISPLHYFSIGQYYYGAENFELKNMLNLLAKKSTKLKELYFEAPPEANLIKQLFERNNIFKIQYNDNSSHGWYRNIPSDKIEELIVTFDNMNAELVPLHECFPNLKKLSLTVGNDEDEDPRNILSQILPHIPGLKTLKLKITCFDAQDSYTLLSDITSLSDLEELTIELIDYYIESPELFFNQLPTCCPKLRLLRLLSDVEVNKESIKRLLSLPHLEIFESRNSFLPQNELPEMKNMSELSIAVDSEDPLFTGLLEAVRKMHCLEELMIDYHHDVEESELLHLFCGVVEAATSLGKNVIVSSFPSHFVDDEYVFYRHLEIMKSGDHEVAEKVLELAICDYYYYYDLNKLCDGIATFVRNKLHSYKVVEL